MVVFELLSLMLYGKRLQTLCRGSNFKSSCFKYLVSSVAPPCPADALKIDMRYQRCRASGYHNALRRYQCRSAIPTIGLDGLGRVARQLHHVKAFEARIGRIINTTERPPARGEAGEASFHRNSRHGMRAATARIISMNSNCE